MCRDKRNGDGEPKKKWTKHRRVGFEIRKCASFSGRVWIILLQPNQMKKPIPGRVKRTKMVVLVVDLALSLRRQRKEEKAVRIDK